MRLGAAAGVILFFVMLNSCKKDNPSPVSPPFAFKSVTIDGVTSGAFVDVSVSPTIVIKFSDKVDQASVSSGVFLTSNVGNATFSSALSNGDSTLTLTVTSPLKYWTNYILQILTDLKTVSGKNIETSKGIKIITIIDPSDKFPRISDDALLDTVQRRTIRYFYNFSHPASGMARERNSSQNTVTTGGSGFGLMALIVGIDRGFINHADGIAHFNKIVTFLEGADRFHGAWSHWIDGSTGHVIPFGPNDNGADLVETSFLTQGLLTVREYLKRTPSDTVGNDLIVRIDNLWRGIEWDWFRKEDQQNVLYWHWSPDKAWVMNFALSGYFEEQITYFLAASSPTHGIPKIVYSNGYGQNGGIVRNRTFTYNNESYRLPLGDPAPLFWVQYSYLGLDPHFSDDYANYWEQNVNATLINHAFCVANPNHYAGYSDSCWGLTASDNPDGYEAQSPYNDNGTITPTAALSSFPYTPEKSMKALEFFYYKMGDKLLGPAGFYDAFNISRGWVASSTLAIDQGPIVVMIENHRTKLLWNLFMAAPEVQQGINTLNFQY